VVLLFIFGVLKLKGKKKFYGLISLAKTYAVIYLCSQIIPIGGGAWLHLARIHAQLPHRIITWWKQTAKIINQRNPLLSLFSFYSQFPE
jgi:hypothetical protein